MVGAAMPLHHALHLQVAWLTNDVVNVLQISVAAILAIAGKAALL